MWVDVTPITCRNPVPRGFQFLARSFVQANPGDDCHVRALHSREGRTMISRIWHGWTARRDADTYEAMLRAEILPGIHRVDGYRGAYMLRRDAGQSPNGDEVEFVTITMFDDLDAVRRFAGEEWTRAVIHPDAAPLLVRYDEHSAHYDTRITPEDVQRSAERT
jgi:heme-degrading monooxygenase HmoA